MIILDTIGKRIKELRKARGLNQEALTAALNQRFNTSITRPMISKWETDRDYPRTDFITNLGLFFNVSMDYLVGNSPYKNVFEEIANNSELVFRLKDVGIFPSGELIKVPILGDIKAGYNHLANEILLGYEYIEQSTLSGKLGCFFLKIKGDSMQPMFIEGDLVLIQPVTDVESGTIAAVLVNEEEATLKRLIKQENSVILQPLNLHYEPLIFVGQEIENLKVIGKVIQSIRKF